MSIFETILLIVIIPIIYVITYIGGKYDVLGRLIDALEEKVEKKVDRSPIICARKELDTLDIKSMVNDEKCSAGVCVMIENVKRYLDYALED